VIYSGPEFNLQTNNTKTLKFITKYKKKNNEEPSNWSANSYDAVMMVINCIDNYGYNSENIKKCLYNIKDYPGIGGKTTFDEYGEVIKPTIIKTIKEGEFVKFEEN